MFYNYSLVGYFALLFVSFWAIFQGLIVLKTGTLEVPLAREIAVDPRVGFALIVFGAMVFLALVVLLFV